MKKLFDATYWIGISIIVIPLMWNIIKSIIESKDSTDSVIAIGFVLAKIGVVLAAIGVVGGIITSIIKIEDDSEQSEVDEFIKKPH